MEHLYQQALAAMPVEDVEFILSQIGAGVPPTAQTNSGNDAATGMLTSDDEDENRRRRHIEREWPDIGTILSSEYYGTTYTAEIIPATKRLKSGKQIRLTSDLAQGIVCDSFSEAMLCATEIQRNEQSLGRKGTSNGWVFWDWPGKPENIAGGVDDADDD